MIIVLVVADSLRADHLAAYGSRSVGPGAFEELAAAGALFETAWSCSPWTLPSLAGMLTGVYGHRVGLVHWKQPWPARIPTLFDRLAERGFATASFVFDPDYLFTGLPAAGVRGRSTDQAELFGLLSGWRGGDLLLFVHYWGTHIPYIDRPMSTETWKELSDAMLSTLNQGPELREKIRALYRLGVDRFNGRFLPRLLAALAEAAPPEESAVVITADHGETWGERAPAGREVRSVFDLHGEHLFDEALRVPLLVWAPGQVPAGQRIGGLARTVDLTPTLLELAGAPADAGDGISLCDSLRTGASAPATGCVAAANVSFLELTYGAADFPPPPEAVWDRFSLRNEHRKWIWNAGTGERSAFDLAVDPGEAAPLHPSAPELEDGWRQLAREQARARLEPFPADLVETERARAAAVLAEVRRGACDD